MKIKVCGLKNYENISHVILAGADHVGFIFHKESPRYFNNSLSFDEMRTIKAEKVGVFVNENMYSVLDKIAHYDLDFVQLHGNEDVDYCESLKPYVKVIKAVSVMETIDYMELKKYEGKVDYFLFDTFTNQHGGSGKLFNWDILRDYALSTPFFLSGGISNESIQYIKQLNIKQLFGVDLNSKFESSPGIKEASKIKQFIKQLK
ncbi:MAG: phosphoribosylanthranilate isomerase [Bacteroidia bacterium]|nr:phosphoribosylanthranilate isomerase [Bacteroidia bacterium]